MSRPTDPIRSMLYGRGQYGGQGFGAAGAGTYGGYGQFAPGGYGGGYGVFGGAPEGTGYGLTPGAMVGYGSPYGSGAGYTGSMAMPYSNPQTPYGYPSFGGVGSPYTSIGQAESPYAGTDTIDVAGRYGARLGQLGQQPEQPSQGRRYDPFPGRGFDPHTMGREAGYRRDLGTSGGPLSPGGFWHFDPGPHSGEGRWVGGNPGYMPHYDQNQKVSWNMSGIEMGRQPGNPMRTFLGQPPDLGPPGSELPHGRPKSFGVNPWDMNNPNRGFGNMGFLPGWR